jgi:trehalose 6-phosphate phosphatase
MNLTQKILIKIQRSDQVWLFLDYDGTLADFAPTPDDVDPDSDLITLLQTLSLHPKIKITIISGRRLSHIEKLVPISGIWLAGSYGLEIRTPAGALLHRSNYEKIRPELQLVKPEWKKLIKGHTDFYLEDKGWSLALHARFADDNLTDEILSIARSVAGYVCSEDIFQLLGGDKFLEVAPKEADKGKTVAYLLTLQPEKKWLPIYIGDDDKDTRAFPVVQSFGGLAGCVCSSQRTPKADFYLKSPQETRDWLRNLLGLKN